MTCEFDSSFSSAFAVCAPVTPTPTTTAPTTWDTGRLLERVPVPVERFIRLNPSPIHVSVVGSGDLSVEAKLEGVLEIRVTLSGEIRCEAAVAGEIAAFVQLRAIARVDAQLQESVQEVLVEISGAAHVDRVFAGEIWTLSTGEGAVSRDHALIPRDVGVRARAEATISVERAMRGEILAAYALDGEPEIAMGEYAKAILGLPSDLTTVLR